MLPWAVWAQSITPPTTVPSRIEANELVLEVLLDGHVLSDTLSAYQEGAQILLPLGELSRLLTLAVTVQPAQGSASGYVVREDRSLALNVDDATVTLSGRGQTFEPRHAQVLGDDIYVSHQLLTRWLPIDLEVDLPRLQLRIKPRVRLPLQERLERERAAEHLRGPMAENDQPSYPRVDAPLQMLSVPFIDQTLGGDARFGPHSQQYKAAYTAYLTADLLGMEGAAFVSSTRDKPAPDLRMTLSRHDPEGGLLGPVQARSLVLGHVAMPSVPQVMAGSPQGKGLLLSNRPLSQPTNFDRHSLRGDLPPGWDVTLYYNDSLVAYQGAGIDGQYAFDDLPLSFGPNEFRLVFNGPTGQVRVERQSFLLDQSIVKPGEFFYSLAQQYADNGTMRSVAQLDLGLTPSIAANAGLVRMPLAASGLTRTYAQAGLRAYGSAMIGSAQVTVAPEGGFIAEGSVKTRLGGYALEWQHTQRVGGFESDQFSSGADALSYRDQLRLNGSVSVSGLPGVSVALDGLRDALRNGRARAGAAMRTSTTLMGTSVSNTVRWQRANGFAGVDGSVQLSRRVLDIGLSGQLDYSLRPQAQLQSVALTADKTLTSGYRINAGLLHTSTTPLTQVSGGVSKTLGQVALALSGSYSTQRELVLGLQMFMAMGRDPRSGLWFRDAQPMAGTGAVSARAFVDRNGNGTRDANEELIRGAAFIINRGGRHPARTDEQGVAMLGRLLPGQWADMALDTSTLEDPQWKPRTPGLRVLPRPGQVEMVEFPVAVSSEVEGTVYLADKAERRGIGDARVELVDEAGQVVASTTSSADGYYLLHQVSPGHMTLRIAPDQAAKLRLVGTLARVLDVPPDGDLIGGQDFELRWLGH